MKKLLIVLGIVVAALVVSCVGLPVLMIALRGGLSSTPQGPGAAAFDVANKLITRYQAGKPVGHGNTEFARKLAKDYSMAMQTATAVMFTGGKEGKISFTDGHFLTYCQLNKDAAVFLLHVPQLRQYKGEVRDTLAELAWAAARNTAANATSPGDTLVVALRGSAIYGPIMVGKVDDEHTPAPSTGTRDILHPYFATDDELAALDATPVLQ